MLIKKWYCAFVFYLFKFKFPMQLDKEKEKVKKVAIQSVMKPPPDFSIISKFALDADLAAYTLSIELQSSIDIIVLRSPVYLEFTDTGEVWFITFLSFFCWVFCFVSILKIVLVSEWYEGCYKYPVMTTVPSKAQTLIQTLFAPFVGRQSYAMMLH